MDEDQMLGRIKDEQSAAWRDGYDTAKAAADAVFADLRTQVAALPGSAGLAADWVLRAHVLDLIDGGDQ